MAEILVTSSQLKSEASALQDLNTQFKQKVDHLAELEAQLSSMWEGEANAAFKAAFTKDKSQMETFYNEIIKYVNALNEIAAKYAQAEATNVQTATTRSY